tara:strand:- start:1156 stop:1380 length:225 start_codon:yes stop_codon:yes gene_type:complete
MNLTMIGNLISTALVAVAVWLSSQWQPNPNNDTEQLVALGLAYGAGLLTAISSQWSIRIEEKIDSEIDGEDNHD